jgi:MFS family permease
MFFAGAFIGSLILPRLADLYGRRPIYLFGLCLYALTAITYPLSRSLQINFALIFLGGISESARYYVGFVYLQEMVPKHIQTYTGLSIFIVHAIAKICYDLFFYKVTKNWMFIGFISIGFVLSAIASVILFLPESPRYLFSKGKVQEARMSFKKMEMINMGKWFGQPTELDIPSRGRESTFIEGRIESNPIIEQIKELKFIPYVRRNPDYVVNIAVMMVNWACSSFCFYLVPYFLSHQLGRTGNLNVFQLSLSQYAGELVACLFSVVLARFFPSSKLALAFSHSLTVIAALIFLLTDHTGTGTW